MMRCFKKHINYLEGENIIPSDYNTESIIKITRIVSDEIKFDINKNLERCVSDLGGRITEVPLHKQIDEGSLYVHGVNDFDIIIEPTAFNRRFRIAHELGHYFLHSKQGEILIVAYRLGIGKLEEEANWFASELLMPYKMFEKEIIRNNDKYRLANFFNVPIGLIEAKQAIFATI